VRANVLIRKKAGLILMLAKALKVSPEKALGLFYPTNTNRLLSNGLGGLHLMCNRSLLRDVMAELRPTKGA